MPMSAAASLWISTINCFRRQATGQGRGGGRPQGWRSAPPRESAPIPVSRRVRRSSSIPFRDPRFRPDPFPGALRFGGNGLTRFGDRLFRLRLGIHRLASLILSTRHHRRIPSRFGRLGFRNQSRGGSRRRLFAGVLAARRARSRFDDPGCQDLLAARRRWRRWHNTGCCHRQVEIGERCVRRNRLGR